MLKSLGLSVRFKRVLTPLPIDQSSLFHWSTSFGQVWELIQTLMWTKQVNSSSSVSKPWGTSRTVEMQTNYAASQSEPLTRSDSARQWFIRPRRAAVVIICCHDNLVHFQICNVKVNQIKLRCEVFQRFVPQQTESSGLSWSGFYLKMFQTQSKVAVPVQLNLLMSFVPSGSTHKPHNYRSNVAWEFRLFLILCLEKRNW